MIHLSPVSLPVGVPTGGSAGDRGRGKGGQGLGLRARGGAACWQTWLTQKMKVPHPDKGSELGRKSSNKKWILRVFKRSLEERRESRKEVTRLKEDA